MRTAPGQRTTTICKRKHKQVQHHKVTRIENGPAELDTWRAEHLECAYCVAVRLRHLTDKVILLVTQGQVEPIKTLCRGDGNINNDSIHSFRDRDGSSNLSITDSCRTAVLIALRDDKEQLSYRQSRSQ